MGTMGDPGGRYAPYTAGRVDGVLNQPGHPPPELRRAVLARAAALRGTGPPSSFPLSGTERGSGGEDALAAYVDTVAQHAYRVTDEHLSRLRQAGHSDDALFEMTVSAALGAPLGRLARAIGALSPPPVAPPPLGPHPPSPPPLARGGSSA